MHTKIKPLFFALLMGLMAIFAFSGVSLASEFSADIVMKGGPMPGKGKVWVKGQKMRQEFGDQAGKMIMIMDLNKGYSWMLMPEAEAYIKNKMDTKGKGFRPENFAGMQQGQMQSQIKRLGTETVNGYECDKYLITFKDERMGTMTQWFAKKLGYPIKMINKSDMMGEVVTELRNIKKGNVQDFLFKIPPGYREMERPQIPQMPTKTQ
ncbi:MAG: DUF4412 domain-containing protein [Thermodesulfobacteriota bacterium]|nr:DUF4412 domain-containing protein [Thermodesulfobacteriota bacterium]